MEEQKIPTRADIPDSDKWDLSHLFSDVDKWAEDFAWLQQTYSKISDWKGRVGKSAASMAACLEFEKSLDLKIEHLYHYASLQLAEDSANPDYLARMGQMQNLLTKISEAGSFLAPEISSAQWRTRLPRVSTSSTAPGLADPARRPSS